MRTDLRQIHFTGAAGSGTTTVGRALAWAAQYDAGDESVRSLRLYQQWLSRLSCPFMTVDGSRPVSALVDEILNFIP